MNLAAAIKRAEAIMNKRAEDEQFDPVYRYEQMQRAIEGAGQKLPTDILDPAGKNISNVFRGPADSILGSQPKRLPPAEVPGIPQYQLRKAVQGALAEKARREARGAGLDKRIAGIPSASPDIGPTITQQQRVQKLQEIAEGRAASAADAASRAQQQQSGAELDADTDRMVAQKGRGVYDVQAKQQASDEAFRSSWAGRKQQAQNFLAGMGRRGSDLYGKGRAAVSSRIPEGLKAPVREFAGKARQAISSRVPQAAKDVIKNLTPGQKTAIMAMLGVGGVGAVVARKAMKPKSKRSKR